MLRTRQELCLISEKPTTPLCYEIQGRSRRRQSTGTWQHARSCHRVNLKVHPINQSPEISRYHIGHSCAETRSRPPSTRRPESTEKSRPLYRKQVPKL